MLEIKTITETEAHFFDLAVNEALKEGWELLRRECFITGSDRAATFYAELERTVEEPEEELDGIADFAEWEITRDPFLPYRCSNCGFKSKDQWATCPGCNAAMGDEE